MLERFEPIRQIVNADEALFVSTFVIDYLLQKVCEDLMALKLILTLLKHGLPLLELLLKPLDFLMLLNDFLFLLGEFLFLVLPLERVLLQDYSFVSDVFYHFLLFFLVFLTLGIQLFCPVNDGIFLTVKVFVVIPLFSLFLQKPNCLQRPLT